MKKYGEWLICPVCNNKTRTMVRQYTTLTYFPLFCPKCKTESLIDVSDLNISIVEEPDVERRADN